MNTNFSYPLAIPHTMPAAIADGVRKNINEISEIYGKYALLQKEISSSPDLTKEGKQKKLSELGTQILSVFAEFEKGLGGYDVSIQHQKNKMKITEMPEQTTLSFLKEKELRDILYSLDPLQLEVEYRKAVLSNDNETIMAFENAPKLKPLVSPKLVEELKMERMEAIYPDEIKAISNFKMAKSLTMGALNSARNELEKGGITFPVDDPVAKLASGGN